MLLFFCNKLLEIYFRMLKYINEEMKMTTVITSLKLAKIISMLTMVSGETELLVFIK